MQSLASLLDDRSAQQVARRLAVLGLRQTGGLHTTRSKGKDNRPTFITKSLDEIEAEVHALCGSLHYTDYC